MDTVLHSPDLDESEIRVRVEAVHRQSHPLFSVSTQTDSEPSTLQQTDSEPSTLLQSINNGHKLRASHVILKRSSSLPEVTSEMTSSSRRCGSVIAPYRCAIRSGRGSYLFMGRIRLKRAILKCAPRREHFLKVYRTALANGSHYCTLDDV